MIAFLFYFTVVQGEKETEPISQVMLETAISLKKNSDYILLWISKMSQASGKHLDTHFKHLLGVIHPDIMAIKSGQQIMQRIQLHTNEVLTHLTEITQKNLESPAREKANQILNQFILQSDTWTQSKVFEKAFESFYDIFTSKGVISVNSNDGSAEREAIGNSERAARQDQTNADQEVPSGIPSPVQSKNTPAKKSSQIYPDETFGAGYERKSFGDKLLIQELREFSGGNNRLLDKIDCPFFMFQPDTHKVKQKKPWLPEMKKDRKYTLVLDLDETLIHFEETQDGTSHFLLRPGAQNFIKEMAKYYEVVIFTAAQKDYADFILDRMDTEGSISHRLYRNNCSYCDNVYQKDLSKLDRDLSKTMIVDNNPDNFQLQPENGIYIRSWYNDPDDEALTRLAPLLIGNLDANLRNRPERLL
jgi:Dullard-like phosphatase family protein